MRVELVRIHTMKNNQQKVCYILQIIHHSIKEIPFKVVWNQQLFIGSSRTPVVFNTPQNPSRGSNDLFHIRTN
jgi:hypothetical protein